MMSRSPLALRISQWRDVTHKTVAMLFAAALTPITATAQTCTRAQFQRYVFVAPGGVTGGRTTPTTLHGGGGFEVVTPTGWGGGAELGYLSGAFPEGDDGDIGIGLLSFNGSYRIRGWGTSRAVPCLGWILNHCVPLV
jgi:hypothetical protein